MKSFKIQFIILAYIIFSLNVNHTNAQSKPPITGGTGDTMNQEPPNTGTTGKPPNAGTTGKPPNTGTTGKPPNTGATGMPPNTGDTGEKPTPSPSIPILRNPLAGLGIGGVGDLVDAVVRFVVVVGSPLCALAIIWAGFSFLLAQGDPTKIGKAKEQLKWTIIGTCIVFGASLIAKVVTGTITELLK